VTDRHQNSSLFLVLANYQGKLFTMGISKATTHPPG